jgi:hypothetical protein
MMGYGIENYSFSKELRVDIAVVEELTEPELTLIEFWYLFTTVADNP